MVQTCMDVVIAPDDPRAEDVRALLESHLTFSDQVTPPGQVHALDLEGLFGRTSRSSALAEAACCSVWAPSNGWTGRMPS